MSSPFDQLRAADQLRADTPGARFGIAVDDDNGHHVRFRLLAATGGAHLGWCGQLCMRVDEYAAFRRALGPYLTDRADAPTGIVEVAKADVACCEGWVTLSGARIRCADCPTAEAVTR